MLNSQVQCFKCVFIVPYDILRQVSNAFRSVLNRLILELSNTEIFQANLTSHSHRLVHSLGFSSKDARPH